MKTYEEIFDRFLSTAVETLNAEEIYDAMMQALIPILNADGLLLMMKEQSGDIFRVTREFGNISYLKKYSVPDQSVLQRLRQSDSFICVDNCNSKELIFLLTVRKQEWLKLENIKAFYTIKYNNSIIGFLYIADHKHQPLDSTQRMYLDKICHYTAYTLRNANLYQTAYRASITDELTSLYNRKNAFERIEQACALGHPKTLLIFDIDDFKLYNELYGSKEGDELVYRCAQVVLQEMEQGDAAFRFGADELMVLKDGDNIDSVRDFAQRVIFGISESFPSDTVWDATITCGISTFPNISKDAASFLHNAEQAVYYGKMEGKGHIITYSKGLENRSNNPDIRATYERIAPTIYALTAAIDAKDTYTFVHSMNVSKYAVILAEALGMNDTEIEIVREASLLHDIGKISIPEHILKKDSRLSDEEYSIMKTHVENSTKMIRYLPNMDYVIPAVVGHHERYDGKGYPRGLAGEDIPYMARILTIADCFDAMTAKRPYKQPMSVSYAINELERNSGTQFDPELAKKFISLIYEGKITV